VAQAANLDLLKKQREQVQQYVLLAGEAVAQQG
jgi:hypothetical protein